MHTTSKTPRLILPLLALAALAAAASTPALAQAVFKCEANGKTAYQSEPCTTAGSKPLDLKVDAPSDPAEATRRAEREKQKAGIGTTKPTRNDETKAANQAIAAQNQAIRCNAARQQLGVLKEPRRVYSYDNKGERQYVDDKNRQAEIAAATQRVEESCK